jgi:hypothetical protein
MILRLHFAFVVLALALAASTCTDPVSPREPVPGLLSVRMTTPHADDGALILRVTGPDLMADIAPGSTALRVFHRAEARAFNAAVFGDLESGMVLLRFRVPDVASSAEYSATLVEAADEANSLRSSIAGYALTIER